MPFSGTDAHVSFIMLLEKRHGDIPLGIEAEKMFHETINFDVDIPDDQLIEQAMHLENEDNVDDPPRLDRKAEGIVTHIKGSRDEVQRWLNGQTVWVTPNPSFGGWKMQEVHSEE